MGQEDGVAWKLPMANDGGRVFTGWEAAGWRRSKEQKGSHEFPKLRLERFAFWVF